jgi:hypothetical protein
MSWSSSNPRLEPLVPLVLGIGLAHCTSIEEVAP